MENLLPKIVALSLLWTAMVCALAVAAPNAGVSAFSAPAAQGAEGVEEGDAACNKHTDCASCTGAPSWLGQCRWCPRDNRCHAHGSLLNPCRFFENFKDPKLCDCRAGCSMTAGAGPEVCAWYLTGDVHSAPENPALWQGRHFLPESYSAAAHCACTGGGNPLWGSKVASCVRAAILELHLLLPAEHKLQMRQATLSGSAASFEPFVPLVHDLHQAAYDRCCCPGTVAPLESWKLIFYFGKYLAKACDDTVGETMAILEVGRCGCNW